MIHTENFRFTRFNLDLLPNYAITPKKYNLREIRKLDQTSFSGKFLPSHKHKATAHSLNLVEMFLIFPFESEISGNHKKVSSV